MRAPLHLREVERLAAVAETGLVGVSRVPLHDEIVRLAAELCDTPIAAISLIEAERQWFPGITGLETRETPRDVAFCAHAILQEAPLVVGDATADDRFADNALVTGEPGIRFYAGVPLVTADKLPLGSLCVIDTKAREISPRQLESLKTLAAFVTSHLELSRQTNQLRAERELKEMLVEHATDYAMITLDTAGRVTSWNAGAERIKGYSREEIIGSHYRTFFGATDRENGVPEAMLAEAAETGRAQSLGWRVRKDGTPVHVVGSVSAVRDGSGRCTGFVQVTRDDTAGWRVFEELQRRTAEVAEANEMLSRQAAELEVARRVAEDGSRSKSEFLANMSHEIRTPMTAILGFADILASEIEADSAAARAGRLDCVETIRRNGQHLIAIIDDILDLSKIEAGRMTIEQRPTDPRALVVEVAELMRVRVVAKGLDLGVSFADSVPPHVMSDPLRLRQILINLVGNAVKFTERGGVTVRVSAGSGKLRFDICDTGIGLSVEQIGKLFGAFIQADSSTTRRFGGSGLGLRISKRLSEMLGGDISIVSQPGVGSTFTATVSTGKPSPDVTASITGASSNAPAPAAAHRVLAGVRVLVVEDGLDNQRLIQFHLRRTGAEVVVVENGRCAVEALTGCGTVDGRLLESPPVDLIVTDMQMPEMDGYTAVRLLRTKGCLLPIVALTAHAMLGDEEACLAAGCDTYSSKPVDRDRLVIACRLAMARRAAETLSLP